MLESFLNPLVLGRMSHPSTAVILNSTTGTAGVNTGSFSALHIMCPTTPVFRDNATDFVLEDGTGLNLYFLNSYPSVDMVIYGSFTSVTITDTNISIIAYKIQ